MRKNNWFRNLLFILLIACMVFVFLFSAQSKEISAKLSEKVTRWIVALFVSDYYRLDTDIQLAYIDQLQHIIRKAAHVVLYCFLGIFTTSIMLTYKMPNKAHVMTAFGFCLIYAVTDEVHQISVTGRGARVYDVGIDSIGALLGIFLTLCVYGWIRKKANSIRVKKESDIL